MQNGYSGHLECDDIQVMMARAEHHHTHVVTRANDDECLLSSSSYSLLKVQPGIFVASCHLLGPPPPGIVTRRRGVVAGASLVPLMIPLSCYCWVVRLQGVALASHMSSTHRTARLLLPNLSMRFLESRHRLDTDCTTATWCDNSQGQRMIPLFVAGAEPGD